MLVETKAMLSGFFLLAIKLVHHLPDTCTCSVHVTIIGLIVCKWKNPMHPLDIESGQDGQQSDSSTSLKKRARERNCCSRLSTVDVWVILLACVFGVWVIADALHIGGRQFFKDGEPYNEKIIQFSWVCQGVGLLLMMYSMLAADTANRPFSKGLSRTSDGLWMLENQFPHSESACDDVFVGPLVRFGGAVQLPADMEPSRARSGAVSSSASFVVADHLCAPVYHSCWPRASCSGCARWCTWSYST